MNDQQNSTVSRCANANESLLILGVILIWKRNQEGVIENRFCFVKANSMFPAVLACLLNVPFEY